MIIGKTTDFVRAIIHQVLGPGDIAIDATVGNGFDTLMLAETVGPSGVVHGFDVQKSALVAAQARLRAAGLKEVVKLHHAGHESMAAHLPEHAGLVGAAMFNLGYLPGSDETVITRGETTCAAIDAALTLLRPLGVLTIVLYTGHPGGKDEVAAVEAHCAALSPRYAQVMACHKHNHSDPKIRVLLLEKNTPANKS